MRVANRRCVRRLGVRSMKASATRNIIAVLAIALTTMLFTALFTIAGSIGYAVEQANFRQVGGYAHGAFKYLTKEQLIELREVTLLECGKIRLLRNGARGGLWECQRERSLIRRTSR